jgi:hypothetical protein
VLLAVLVVGLVATVGSLRAAPPEAGGQPEYTVASTEVHGVATGGTVVALPIASLPRASERLTLVAVGGLLLGLAAAVRRTT